MMTGTEREKAGEPLSNGDARPTSLRISKWGLGPSQQEETRNKETGWKGAVLRRDVVLGRRLNGCKTAGLSFLVRGYGRARMGLRVLDGGEWPTVAVYEGGGEGAYATRG